MALNKTILKKFYDDTQVRDEFKAFLEAHLDELALAKVYAKEDTAGLADAKDAIYSAFKQLDEEFAPKEKTSEYQNPAR